MTNHVILNNVEHKNLKLITERSAELGDNMMAAPLFPREFRSAQIDYPIFFHKHPKTDMYSAFAIFGFEEGENLFLEGNRWNASYMPYLVEKGPFLIAFQQRSDGEQNMVISIDLDHPRVSETAGEALFLPHGGNTKLLERMSSILREIHDAQGETEAFVDAMLAHDLLEPFRLEIELDSGAKHRLEGFHSINEEKLTELDGETLADLSRKFHLQAAYMVVASLSNIRKLIEQRNRQL
jgi:hypothetical protein